MVATQKEYISKNGMLCPICGDEDEGLEWVDFPEWETGRKITVDSRCLKCGAKWRNIMGFKKFIMLEMEDL